LSKAKVFPLSINETLSAVMDDEAGDLELRRLLQAGDYDPTIRARWARYQLARSALQRDLPTAVGVLEIADQVQAALLDDAAPASVAGLARLRYWLQPLTSVAVAASVAMLALLGAHNSGLILQNTSLPPIQEGVVLVEPHDNVDLQLASSSFGAQPVQQAQGKVLRLPQGSPQPMERTLEHVLWQVTNLPTGFILLHRQVDAMGSGQREKLTYSNGEVTFNLIIEPLLGRQIAEGYVTVGADLVLGRSMQLGGQSLFVTLVGQLSLDDAEHTVASLQP
jgi:negative regulator of sigma E activity